MIKIGDKPLSEMTEQEMREAIETLRSTREALRQDNLKRAEQAKPLVKPPAKPSVKPTKFGGITSSDLAKLWE